jgi:hypothetical protein
LFEAGIVKQTCSYDSLQSTSVFFIPQANPLDPRSQGHEFMANHPITGNDGFLIKTTVVGTSPNTKTEQAKSEQNLLLSAAIWYTLPL